MKRPAEEPTRSGDVSDVISQTLPRKHGVFIRKTDVVYKFINIFGRPRDLLSIPFGRGSGEIIGGSEGVGLARLRASKAAN